MAIEQTFSQWQFDELRHQAGKFPHESQVEQLGTRGLLANTNFGGMALNYWKRAQSFESEDEEQSLLMRTQLIGKITPSVTAIWRTMRTHDRGSFDGSDIMPIIDIERVATNNPDFIKIGQIDLAKPDIGDTSFGLGLAWYSKRLEQKSLPTTNLGKMAELLRIREIYLDAARLSLAQFDLCYRETGVLPKGGLSSGNIEIWRPLNTQG